MDTVDLNALRTRAHRIHEDSAELSEKICFEVLHKSVRANYLKGQGDAYLTLGVIYRNKNAFDASYHYLKQSLEIRRAIGDSNSVAAALTNLAINYLEECKYDSAIASVSYAIQIAEALPQPAYDILGSEYLLLSNIQAEYLEPEDALNSARKSLAAYHIAKKPTLIGKASYTLANRFMEVRHLDSALLYYDQAQSIFEHSNPKNVYLPDILINKGSIFEQKGDFKHAGDLYNEAQKLLEALGEQADWYYYYLNKGQLLMAQGDWAESLLMLKYALPDDPTALGFLDRYYLFEDLADAYAKLQRYDSAYYFQRAVYIVRDSLYNENKRKEFIRFQTDRYKLETAQQALLVQQESSRAHLFMLSSVLLLLLALIATYAYVQRKKAFQLIQAQQDKLHRQEVDELIQNNELQYLRAGLEGREFEKGQIARELHDQLGSAIVTLSWQYDAILEHTDRTSENYALLLKLNDSLKHLYQDVRQIAHQLDTGVLHRAGLIPVLNELCQTIESGNTIVVGFSHFGMENRLGFMYEVNVLRIIQELISNVLKYAKATQLLVQINRMDKILNIMVEDNGVGFDQKVSLLRSGMGLANIEARLRSLDGSLQFENRPLGGTTVIINIPVPELTLGEYFMG